MSPVPRTFPRGTPLALALLAAVVVLPRSAAADAVTDWNAVAEQTTAGPPPIQFRMMAITQVAVHDALHAIDPRYDAYLDPAPAAPGASADAAVAAATAEVLVALVPGQAVNVLTIYGNRIAELPPCPAAYPTCVQDGIDAGEAAAAAILAARAGDGSANPHRPYAAPLVPGLYQPTPGSPAPQFEGWAELPPFVMRDAAQFRPPPVPMMSLRGKAYARDFNEVKQMGSLVVRSAAPDSEPSRTARYWPGGGANWNAVTRTIVTGRGLDRWEHARLFALLNIATFDSTISVFDIKYHYRFWRPVTAIRAADTDRNPGTAVDAGWSSYQPTPPYPDYTCGLTTISGAATEVLRRYFRTDKVAYTHTAAGITRSFSSLSQAGADAVDARVYGGMHFRTGCEIGLRQGGRVGRFVFQQSLRQRHGHGH
jgi:hypothetical protein